MSAFFPTNPGLRGAEPEHPRLRQQPMSLAQRRARWEVRAAQWRARELAEHVFGEVSRMAMTGVRGSGEMRALLRLDVPFVDLDVHRSREARFMAAVEMDPLLANVPLLYVIGPHDD